MLNYATKGLKYQLGMLLSGKVLLSACVASNAQYSLNSHHSFFRLSIGVVDDGLLSVGRGHRHFVPKASGHYNRSIEHHNRKEMLNVPACPQNIRNDPC
jgi:hypothetical protein